MSEQQTTAHVGRWFFFSGGPGVPRYGDDPTKHAVNHDTETFVREVLQNANDQRTDDDTPVEVTFRFDELYDDDKERFLDALGWHGGLGTRLEAVADDNNTRGYDQFRTRVRDSTAGLRLLTIEDRNTTGLTGSWNEDSNYAALVRDELYSSKQEDTAGGSYGLGKSVLWTFSEASTVIFNSYPQDRPISDGPRLIARTKLPTHELPSDDDTYQGAGWLCTSYETADGIRPEAITGADATVLAEDLHVTRPVDTGTSAMVVGFRNPTRDTRPELDELATEVRDAAVKYFWPAIHQGDLKVTIETPEETLQATVDSVPAITPFVKAYESRFTDATTLTNPGDVAGLDIPFSLPPRGDGSDTPDGNVRLAAQLASPAQDETYLNRVALFRGTGMVVKYYDQNRIAHGDRNFFAVLACGTARADGNPTAADHEIDRFLRSAEPPDHDEWESTENLREQYKRGFRTALDEMFDTVRDGLRHLVSNRHQNESALSERVLKRFPIHGSGSSRHSIASPTNVFDLTSYSYFEDDRWQFGGTITPTEDDFESWTVTISLAGIGEDGARYDDIPIEGVETNSAAVTVNLKGDTAVIIGDSDATEVDFSGESESIANATVIRGDVGETQLELEAELELEGEY
jgi:hypothetical protein